MSDTVPKECSSVHSVKRTVFVSGHLDLTEVEFAERYVPELHRLVQAGCDFVVGDARGCDYMVQYWFDTSFPFGGAPLTVNHMFQSPRQHHDPELGGPFPTAEIFRTVGGFQSDDERDAAMTAASTEDLAWVRPGRGQSGTAKNLRRRRLGATTEIPG